MNFLRREKRDQKRRNDRIDRLARQEKRLHGKIKSLKSDGLLFKKNGSAQ